MTDPDVVWLISWEYLDGSGRGVINLGYEDQMTADYIKNTLSDENHEKHYTVLKVGIVRGELK